VTLSDLKQFGIGVYRARPLPAISRFSLATVRRRPRHEDPTERSTEERSKSSLCLALINLQLHFESRQLCFEVAASDIIVAHQLRDDVLSERLTEFEI
jgi:hypothetical protein